MTAENNFQTFFNHHAPRYMQEPFVQATQAEVNFLIEHLGLTSGQRILDMGCGTGRHTLELARRGYYVTGVDFSSGMLEQARAAAHKERLGTLAFIQADATRFTTDTPFERAYCVCEGSLGLVGSGQDAQAHDLAILRGLHGALVPGGRLLLTVLNAMRTIRRYQDADVLAGIFDPATLSETNVMTTGSEGDEVTLSLRERGFVIPELRLMLELVGFQVEHIGGGTAGNWGIRQVELDEYELMAIVKKPSEIQ